MSDDRVSNRAPLQLALAHEQRVWQAVVHNDRAALERLFAADYIEITLEGKRFSRQDVVQESPDVDRIENYEINSPEVIRLSDKALALSYHLRLEGKCRGIQITPQDRWACSLWQKEGDAWVCCLFQQSRFDQTARVASIQNNDSSMARDRK